MNIPFSDDGLGGPNADLGMGAVAIEISAEAAGRIEATLASLVDDVELDFATVLDDSSAVLGWAAAAEDTDGEAGSGPGSNAAMVEVMVDCSGALAMGAFAAAQTLAAQLGGEASREMIHHAGSRSFHLTEISRGVALFSVWSGSVALGYLRNSAARAVEVLREEVADLSVSSSGVGIADGLPAQSSQIDFPSSPAAAAGGPERRFPMPSGSNRGLGESERYVFEIG